MHTDARIDTKHMAHLIGQTRGRQAWQLPVAQRIKAIFLISINSSTRGKYFSDTPSDRRKTLPDSFSYCCPYGSEYNTAKAVNLNCVIDELASVKARKFIL
jgi:hypothetical protein